MEQVLDLDLPKKCSAAEENLSETTKLAGQAIEVLQEQAKYIGSERVINAVNLLANHVEEKLVPSYKETAEFYKQTGEESDTLFGRLK